MNISMIDNLTAIGQELYYGQTHRSIASACAENQKVIVQFAVKLMATSPTTYTRKAKQFLNNCGWFTAAQIIRLQSTFSSKYKVQKHLDQVDCHTIRVSNTVYYRALSTGLVSIKDLENL